MRSPIQQIQIVHLTMKYILDLQIYFIKVKILKASLLIPVVKKKDEVFNLQQAYVASFSKVWAGGSSPVFWTSNPFHHESFNAIPQGKGQIKRDSYSHVAKILKFLFPLS